MVRVIQYLIPFPFYKYETEKGIFYNIIIACMASVAMAGCADEENFSSSRSHLLAFSADTVSLDTTFSNVPTPTRSFWVYNRSGKSLRCSTVRLEMVTRRDFG